MFPFLFLLQVVPLFFAVTMATSVLAAAILTTRPSSPPPQTTFGEYSVRQDTKYL